MTHSIDLYDELSEASPETVDINGKVLAWENKGKWHVSQTSANSVSYFCSSGGGPTDPHRSSVFGDDYYKKKHKTGAKVVTPQGFLELDTLCKNCQRKMQDEYNLVRVISAVPSDAPEDAWKGIIERFVERASKTIDESK